MILDRRATIAGVFALALLSACGTTGLDPYEERDAGRDVRDDATECEPCPAIGMPATCEGDEVVSFRMDQDPATCECTFVPLREDCAGRGLVCRNAACVEPDGCTSDAQCIGASPPVCDGDDLVRETGYCDLDAGVCRGREVRVSCAPRACMDGACEGPCTTTCPVLVDRPPYCEGDVAILGTRVSVDPDTCECVFEQVSVDCGLTRQACRRGECRG